MTTHRTPSTVRAAHTALPSSGRNRSSMKPSPRVRSDVPAAGPAQPDSVTRSSSRQDSSTKYVTRMSPGKPTREGGNKSGAKLIRTVLNYELTARCYTTVRWPGDGRNGIAVRALPGAECGLQPGVGGAVPPRVRHHRSRAGDRDRLVLRVLQPPAPAQRHRRHVTDQLRDHRPHPRSGIREPSTISGEPQRWATCISATSGPGTCAGRVLRPPPAVRKRQRTGTGIGAHAQQG